MDKKEDELFAMEVDEGLYNSKGSSSSSKGRTWLIVGLLFFCFLALITPIFNPGIFIIISLLFLGLFLILEACIDNTRLSASILLIIGIISLIAVIILTKSQYSEIQLTLKYIEIERELASLKGDYFSFFR